MPRGVAGCDWAKQSNELEGNEAIRVDVPRATGDIPGVTPMAERGAVLAGWIAQRSDDEAVPQVAGPLGFNVRAVL